MGSLGQKGPGHSVTACLVGGRAVYPREEPRGAACRAQAKLAASAQSRGERQGGHQLLLQKCFKKVIFGPVPSTQGFHCPGQVQSLIRELRSCKECGAANSKKERGSCLCNNHRCHCSVAQSSLTLCHPMDCSSQASLSITISRSLLKLVHRVSDAIQPSHPLSSPSPPAFNPSQHQGLFQ